MKAITFDESRIHCRAGSCDRFGCSCDCAQCFHALFGVKPGIETTATKEAR